MDAAAQKTKQIEHNRQRMQEQLGVLVDGNETISIEERNRYLLAYDPIHANAQKEFGDA